MVSVKFVRWGLAERVDDTIYLNENLQRPEWYSLKEHLLKHELAHDPGSVSTKDVVLDIKHATQNWLPSELMFMWRHPRAWSQVLGVSFREGEVCFDWTNILINCVVVGIAGGLTWWLGKVVAWW
jgi:hypothetical protein